MRWRYYLLSLVFGLVYFFGYIIIRYGSNWSYRAETVIDILYIITTLCFLIGLILKDTNDRIHIKKGLPPVGGPQIEHGPFIFSLSVITIYSIFVFPPSWPIKLCLSIACLLEGLWDLSQDIRTHSLH